MPKKIKVFMGIPSTGKRMDVQGYVLREIEAEFRDRVELVYPKECIFRMFHDYARNAIVEEFLKTDCDVLWFLDSDVSPPIKILELVTEHIDKWMCSGAVYPIWMANDLNDGQRQIYFTGYTYNKNNALVYCQAPKRGLDWLDGLATGCLMIKRSVFAMLEKPYFEFKYDKQDMKMVEGEDLGFCMKVTKLGYKFFTDWNLACRHFKEVDLMDVADFAANHADYKVNLFEDKIKPKILELETALREKMSRPNITQSGLILPAYHK